ncbi:lysophospholipase D GDPD1 isoform X4 [Eurytemora carolleeae]|uniref:lysophospholipase D GDPD1 isoform X1 n=1 Tax=Eurytemora carolleeae TaxID=1294199 RepID=UPI000C76430D|nr:lysophospholipase D GDPD1 isoform X1 [Eurytemora carolleeae]XP_023325224.1 lysophospholipase D GDPD1 isoform X2 [Eurytemora carolleeae]XP_023325225.1 lysophospholipase D GDPD1 isoform X3 [Eurytemora carolleeae]XP_023325226.1 lysophospholipase D GDPD1 isoform X4 [Eurytemora carolleeae]|eukprot:XP_023325223.1 lysophospholipase D GDPD1-like isoform X1 [Eurytemora affinis]
MNYIGLTVGGYAVTSYILLKNPTILHLKKKFRPARIIAHRGGAGEGTENTLTAFRQAVELGCDMLELDVNLTKDGQAVVAHDNNLRRLTGKQSFITETDFNNLPQIQDKVPIDFLPGEIYVSSGINPEERRFCSLEEVLDRFKCQINIDIKEKKERLVEEVDRLIRRYGAQERCVWGSFDGETTDLCFRKNPEVGLFFSAPRLLLLMILFYTGLLPFISLRETHLEIPMLSLFLSPKYASSESTVSFGKLPHFLLKVCNYLLLNRSLIKHLEERGIPTYLWVLNSEEEFEQGLSSGASGIMTDYPSRLKQFYHKINLN